MQEQNFKNHGRMVPLYHFLTFGLILLLLIAGCYKFYRNYQTGIGGLMTPALIVLTSIILVLIAWFTRVFSLKAQDRAIRAEENLRYFAITGNLLDSKLTIHQVIALRFASNNEFVDLAHKAVVENMSSKEIKMAIQNWKADHYRV